MSNILKAIVSITNNPLNLSIKRTTKGKNKVVDVGVGLEKFIANAFSNNLGKSKLKKQKIFSYIGNTTSPPDLILRCGDAIEVKKIGRPNAVLQFNSSYPKSKLLVDDTKLTNNCKKCEDWISKDLVYCIGYVKNNQLKSLWMVYGDCYAADDSVYRNVELAVKTSIQNNKDFEINNDTKELSGIKNIDPLKIANLRVRAMWTIENPSKVFEKFYTYDANLKFQLIVVMRKEKFNSFPKQDIKKIKSKKNVKIKPITIPDPNNNKNLLDALLITFKSN